MPSSVIAAYAYDAATLTLRITYTSGAVYDYLQVPESVYNDFRSSGARGVYLNRIIKKKYDYKKIAC